MTIKFDKDLAMLVGVNGAIVYVEISRLLQDNVGDPANYRMGFYWTKVSLKELHEKLPFLSTSEIRTGIRNLEVANVLKEGCFGGGTRSKWYAIIKKFGG